VGGLRPAGPSPRERRAIVTTARSEFPRCMTKRSPIAPPTDAGRVPILIDSVIDYAIYMLDLEGRVDSWNAGAVRLKGFTSEESPVSSSVGFTRRKISQQASRSWRSKPRVRRAAFMTRAGAFARAAR